MDAFTLKTSLSFVYRLMVAAEPLLERAIAKADGDLRTYLAHHLEEERGHIGILAADLARLDVAPIPRFHLAELMAGGQYYLIEHEHPAALLGYMAALEGRPLPLGDVDTLEAQFGPLNALRLHAEHDPQHLEDLRAEIARLPYGLRMLAQMNEQRVLNQLDAAPSVIFTRCN